MKQLNDKLAELGITDPEKELTGKSLRKYQEFKRHFMNKSASHIDYKSDPDNPKRRPNIVQKLEDLFEDILIEVQIKQEKSENQSTVKSDQSQESASQNQKEKSPSDAPKNTQNQDESVAEETKKDQKEEKKSGGFLDIF